MSRLPFHTSHSSFILRPFTSSDSPRVVEVVNADAWQSLGIRRAAVDGVGNVRLIRYVPVTSEKVVAIDAQGALIGYAYLADREQSIVYEVGGAVYPNNYGQGVGALLLQWAEQRAADLSRHAPIGVKTVLQANLFEDETRARRLFSARGYTRVREWLHFEIDLTTPPQPPAFPGGISLHPMDLENDWELVGPAMDAAFADHWGVIALLEGNTPDVEAAESLDETPEDEAPEDESYSNAPGFCFYARDGSQVIGGVLCNAKLVERDDSGRVGSVFVRPEYRRQGLGRALMYAAFDAFWQAGLRRVILDTDAESFSAAPRFYTSLGMRSYRRELLYEKEIRPGREIRCLQAPS